MNKDFTKQCVGVALAFGVIAGSSLLAGAVQEDRDVVADALLQNSASLTEQVTDTADRAAYRDRLSRVVAAALKDSGTITIHGAKKPFSEALDTGDTDYKVVFVDMPFKGAVFSLYDSKQQTFYVSDDIREQDQVETLAKQFRQLGDGAYSNVNSHVFVDAEDGVSVSPDADFDSRSLIGAPASQVPGNCTVANLNYQL